MGCSQVQAIGGVRRRIPPPCTRANSRSVTGHVPGVSPAASRFHFWAVVDLTGDAIDDGTGRTVTFGFNGAHYEIDLTDDNAEAFSDYVAARKVTGRSVRTTAGSAPKRGNSEELANIRAWANANGHEVSSRGRISQTVRDAYNAAH